MIGEGCGRLLWVRSRAVRGDRMRGNAREEMIGDISAGLKVGCMALAFPGLFKMHSYVSYFNLLCRFSRLVVCDY